MRKFIEAKGIKMFSYIVLKFWLHCFTFLVEYFKHMMHVDALFLIILLVIPLLYRFISVAISDILS